MMASASSSRDEGRHASQGDGRGTELFPGGGELGVLMRGLDWAATPLGDPESWPQSLKTIVRVLLTSRFAMWMGWGRELTFLYNDAYARMTLGKKHPWALGKPSREVWAEIWDDIGPRIQRVLDTGEATWDQALLLFLERSGYREETYHTFSYSPLYGEDGRVAGNLCVVSEETERVIGERRLGTLRSLASELSTTTTEEDVMTAIERSLRANGKDLPFTLTYIFDGENRARLASRTGIESIHRAAPAAVATAMNHGSWPIGEMLARGAPVQIGATESLFGTLPTGTWDESPRSALLVPIANRGQEGPAGVLIAGLNPYRKLESDYRGFIELIAGQIAGSLANARAYEQERKRAESLAELDRAKTTFFSNVSHEFRTPLTLMLGPLEEILSRPDLAVARDEHFLVRIAHRNGIRLLKLVNTLLDFSRIEAGRAKALYQPTDLGGFTSELASLFQSAAGRARLELTVSCAKLGRPVYVDRDMWEKVVLNLLSNAFKFTFEGRIAVGLRETGAGAELTISDTGVGIPEADLPRLFERFHRVEGTRGRSFEGSGIGLALVQELVKLHGGTITVESRLGRGTTFSIEIPFGPEHLPPDHVSHAAQEGEHGTAASSYVTEALSWLDTESRLDPEVQISHGTTHGGREDEATSGQTILVVDDNHEMREYIARLLRGHFTVMRAENGKAALEILAENVPDLVLADIMMPEMDGFQLLAAIRRDRSVSTIPVILLSARAGEEARVEGIERGADDYLVKPFSAPELLARVRTHLELARTRKEALEAVRQTEQRLRRTEKLAAAGQLAASLAHEINNPLSSVTNALYLLKEDQGLRPEAQSLAEIASSELARVSRIVKQSLSYYRIGTVAKPFDLAAIVEESLQIFSEKFQRGSVAMRKKLVPGATIVGFADEVRQVIDNLLLNAIEATSSGGHLAISVHPSRNWVNQQAGVRLTIGDSGSGIPKEVLPKIFEPFFTTKAEKGTGLGLWVVRGIVAKHDGSMAIRSAAGKTSGTVLSILWPSTKPESRGMERAESALQLR